MTRHLTPEEINDILNHIRSPYNLVSTISHNIHKTFLSTLQKDLQSVKIYPSKIPELKHKLSEEYEKCKVIPGTPVGILSAQCIGEKQTQLTLNTFHSAGRDISAVSVGVPRFGELLNASKNPKKTITKLYFKKKYKSIDSIRQAVAGQFININLKSLIKTMDINPEKIPLWFKLRHPHFKYSDQSKYILLTLRSSVIYRERIILDSLKSKVFPEGCIIYPSPQSVGQVLIQIDDVSEWDLYHSWIGAIKNIHVVGISGITNIWYNQKTDYIEVFGTSLKSCLGHPLVDSVKTFSNDMWDILNIFGIEAVREFLINEFLSVVSSDSYMNPCHVELLVDVMTWSGSISSVNRYGVKRTAGPMTRASFEESLDNFLKAAAHGEVEEVNGVSAAIICGKTSRVGSGFCDILYDEEIK
jgi:DNA-directed RNA polymerase II subunit RPB1